MNEQEEKIDNTAGASGAPAKTLSKGRSSGIGGLVAVDDLYVDDANALDWDALAKKFVPSRSGIDCRIQWTGHDDPSIPQTAWSKDEEKRLKHIVEEHKGYNWVTIAAQLGTGRSALACLTKYQRDLQKGAGKGNSRTKWSKEEDEQLRRLVSQYGDCDWQNIVAHMSGRLEFQVMHRWQKSLDPSIKSGRWSDTEDLRLRLATVAFRSHPSLVWAQVQRLVPGRTDVKCRERWVNVLAPTISKEKWEAHEDEKLLLLEPQHKAEDGKVNWAKVKYTTFSYHITYSYRLPMILVRGCMCCHRWQLISWVELIMRVGVDGSKSSFHVVNQSLVILLLIYLPIL
jgi:hypothetical protein